MNNEFKNKVCLSFIDAITTYETKHSIDFGDNTKIKLADSYASTLLMEKDISPLDWIEENIEDILETYKEEIILKN